MKDHICQGPGGLDSIAQHLLRAFPGERLFAVSGAMGAGKTTFIKALCRQLGVTDLVASPSFAVIHEYRTSGGDPVFHFDFYRIQNTEEVYDIGYEEYFFSGHYCFIEWPEKITGLLPEHTIHVTIAETGMERDRKISF